VNRVALDEKAESLFVLPGDLACVDAKVDDCLKKRMGNTEVL